MIHPVATQQLPPGPRARTRRSGTTEHSRSLRTGIVQVAQGRPGISPNPVPSNASVRRLRLARVGGQAARTTWRLTMNTTDSAIRLPGLTGALRLWSAMRTGFALLGLAVVLAAALPAPRETVLRQVAAWAE